MEQEQTPTAPPLQDRPTESAPKLTAARLKDDIDSERLGKMDRLIGLSDGLYAFAMTLLAVNVDIPRLAASASHEEVTQAVLNLLPEVVIYVTSFLLVATYWQVHRRLTRYIQYSDGVISWLILLQLMFVAFLPVATGMFDTYSNTPLVIVIYAGTLLLIGILGQLMWTHAVRAKLVDKDIHPLLPEYYTFRGRVTIAIYSLMVLVGFFFPGYARYVLFLLLLVYPFLQRIFRFQYKLRHKDLA